VRVARLRLLIETVLQKLFAVKLNLVSANSGVVFMRRPNKPYAESNEYDYQNYIWKDLAERIMKKEKHTAGDTTVDELAVRLEAEFDEQMSADAFIAAEKWLKGFDSIMPELDGVDMPYDGKSTLVFSILGVNLMGMLCEVLEVNTERITIEQKRSATSYLREFSKILMWIGANVDQLKKDVPSVE
jgi:hypothetical protein